MTPSTVGKLRARLYAEHCWAILIVLQGMDAADKRRKFSIGDIAERTRWNKYAAAHEDMIRATSRAHAPWHVVPADHKWFARLAVATAMVDALERLDLKFPRVEGAARKDLATVGKALVSEGRGDRGSRSKRN